MERSALCRSRRELSKKPVGTDTAENEPYKVCPIPRGAASRRTRTEARAHETVVATHADRAMMTAAAVTMVAAYVYSTSKFERMFLIANVSLVVF